jgi:hypothetical protein
MFGSAQLIPCYAGAVMKCPHCLTAIHQGLTTTQFAQYQQVTTENGAQRGGEAWNVVFMRCPQCFGAIIFLDQVLGPNTRNRYLAYPQTSSRPVPAEVTDPYRRDFTEAVAVLPFSPKASAALSRRNLQAILRDKANAKKKDLVDQIDEVSPGLPSYIADSLHAVRNIGNFAAHPMKSKNTGDIVDVEAGEAEWNLDVLEMLFDFYFVQPEIAAKRKAELNKKLSEAGKPLLP